MWFFEAARPIIPTLMRSRRKYTLQLPNKWKDPLIERLVELEVEAAKQHDLWKRSSDPSIEGAPYIDKIHTNFGYLILIMGNASQSQAMAASSIQSHINRVCMACGLPGARNHYFENRSSLICCEGCLRFIKNGTDLVI